jgi:hypothetical protein
MSCVGEESYDKYGESRPASSLYQGVIMVLDCLVSDIKTFCILEIYASLAGLSIWKEYNFRIDNEASQETARAPEQS